MATTPQVKYRINIHVQEQRSRYYVEDLGNGILLKMVEIPAGRFVMGSPDDEAERSENEGPQHEVILERFFMGMYPVTQAQWRVVAALPPVNQDVELDPDPSQFKGSDRPVEKVLWWGAAEFCARLSKSKGRAYGLPTEAEWEYACRAGTTSPFHFGETVTTDLANYNGTDETDGAYGRGPKGISRGETTPVGSFPANAFGLYDMHGNVWEWCADRWHDSYADKPDDLKANGNTAWETAETEVYRSVRGGSWISDPRSCRSAYRGCDLPGERLTYNGFRVVCRAARTLS
jgi:formylglycine-generating enzyme required for sulfatase activity